MFLHQKTELQKCEAKTERSKWKIDKFIIILGDFSTLLSTIDNTIRIQQAYERTILLILIKHLIPQTAEYTFLTIAHETVGLYPGS